jgi:hypothetical protein
MRRQPGNTNAVIVDRAGFRSEETADSLHDRRLAGAVEPDQPRDRARFDRNIHIAQNVDVADISGRDLLHAQDRAHATAPPR